MNFKLDAPATIRASSYGRILSLVDGRGCEIVVLELRVASLGLDGPSWTVRRDVGKWFLILIYYVANNFVY